MTGYAEDIINSTIDPNNFMGIEIENFYVGIQGLFPGTNFSFKDYIDAPVQSITAIRLDSKLTVKLEKTQILDMTIYHNMSQEIFSHEDIGKTIKVALLAN